MTLPARSSVSEPTSPPVEEARTLTELLRVAVDRDPTALAVESETFSLSFEALYAEVQGLAGAIAERCKPGDRIAVCTARGPEATLAMHAVLAARGVAVPVSLNPAARARAVLDDCGAALVVASGLYIVRREAVLTKRARARRRAPAR